MFLHKLGVFSAIVIASGMVLTMSGQSFDEVFKGARWIGSASDELPVYADNLSVFRLECDVKVKSGENVSLLFGMNDPRLMSRNLNIYNLENSEDASAVRVRIDGDGTVSLYRYGYHTDDRVMDNDNSEAAEPLAKFRCEMKSGFNRLEISENLGHTAISMNGKEIGRVGINPMGNGGDYLAFPVLAEMAVDISEGSRGVIKDVRIRNFRDPGNVIYEKSGEFSRSTKIHVEERSMPELQTVIVIPEGKKVKNAEVSATARGIYTISINGRRLTESYFNPGSTQYNKTHIWQRHDLKDFLRPGKNVMDVQLAEGWWSGPSTFMGEYWNFYGDRQSFIAVVDVDYEDGTHDRFVTSPDSWTVSADGPVVAGSFFNGEVYDATRENSPGRNRRRAVEIALDSTVCGSVGDWSDIKFRPDVYDRVLPVDTLTAVAMTEPRQGVYVYDLGQNTAGVPLLTFQGLRPGQEVTVRYAEVLYPDMPRCAANAGMIMTENLRAAMCRDIYRGAGRDEENFSPRNTLHGYRYIELTGLEKPLALSAVRSVALSSVHDFKAHYECSDTLVNRLWENVKWSTLSNFISIPTDCPQRNERLGWMGDISVFSPTATKLADVKGILKKYLQSVRDCQHEDGKFPDVVPAGVGFGGFLWGSAGITVPYELLRQYGDTATVREHYPAMKKYMEYVRGKTMDPNTGIIVQNHEWGDLADWLSPEYDRTDKSLLWECYYIYDLGLMAEMARAIDTTADAAEYSRMREERIRFFRDNYVDADNGMTIWSGYSPERRGSVVDTQVSYALPIAMGIYNEPKFVENFLKTVTRENKADDGTVCPPYSLMTGFIGTAWISEALSKSGHPEMAYRLLTSRNYPSWLYPVTQGATTVWERLNSYTHRDGFGNNNSMNSFNHYSFGSVGNWLLTRSLGINSTADGKIEIRPEADMSGSVSYASGWMDTPQGRVRSSWRIEPEEVVYDIEMPCEGTLVLPSGSRPLHAGHNSIRQPR